MYVPPGATSLSGDGSDHQTNQNVIFDLFIKKSGEIPDLNNFDKMEVPGDTGRNIDRIRIPDSPPLITGIVLRGDLQPGRHGAVVGANGDRRIEL